ncbi:MAG TPA: hypothetical protein DDZ19_01295 [Flavobacteriales bacterium]|jgi:FtsP/CotA-like multicopper oxidase with cupredoxin domain|nr:hypothetical protein [Flavobacteriales bacterium]
MKNLLILAILSLGIAGSSARAQQVPPQLFSGMDGYTFLPDGTPIPIWGYGWVADGYITLPGPLLSYEQGDFVQLNFSNPSPESHTIHLHGLDVDQANDGVPSTSFLLVTGDETTYEFTAAHSGTFLYHCHVTTTLHLTMGMYGMVLVTRPDMTLYEEGPAYSEDIPLLFSDLAIETNLDPVGSYPFHDIRPDVFMVNGVSGDQLEASDRIVHFEPGQPLALRLGSVAYSLIRCIFPEELNAVCYMSDGRPVPNAFAPDTLDIFPGERFTVLIEPDADWDGHLPCEFWSLADGTLEGTESIHIRDAALEVPNISWDQQNGFPNPANHHIQWSGSKQLTVTVFDARGNFVTTERLEDGVLDVRNWPNGVYIATFPNGSASRFIVTE